MSPIPLGILAASGGAYAGPYWVASYANASGFGFDYAVSDSLKNTIAVNYTRVVKYNSAGVIQWQRELGAISSFTVQGIDVDASNNIYLSGPGAPVSTWDTVIVKFDASGNLVWKKYLESGGNNQGRAVRVAPSGNIYLNGYTVNSGCGTYKLDSNGNIQWGRDIWNGVGYGGIGVDSSENVYTVDGGGNVGSYAGWWVTKYNSAGTLQWARIANEGAVVNSATASFTDTAGNTYIAGLSRYASQTYLKFVKMNSSGNISLQRSLNIDAIGATGIHVDSTGNIFVGGKVNTSNAHIIAKWDSAGNLQWVRTIGITHYQGNHQQGITAAADGSLRVGTMASNSTAVVARLNTNGGGTGTYTPGGNSVVYATSGATALTPVFSAINNSNVTNVSNLSVSVGTVSQAISTPTLATAVVTIG